MEPDYMRALKPDYDNFIQMPEIPTNVPQSVYNGNCIVESDSLEDFGTQQCKNGVPQKDVENQNDELFAAFPFKQDEMAEFDSFINSQQLGGQNERGVNNLGNDFKEQICREGSSTYLSSDVYKINDVQRYNEAAYQKPIDVVDQNVARYYQFPSTSVNSISDMLLHTVPTVTVILPHPDTQEASSCSVTLPDLEPTLFENADDRTVICTNQLLTSESQSKRHPMLTDHSNEPANYDVIMIEYRQQFQNEEQSRTASVTVKEAQPYPTQHFQFSDVSSAAQKNRLGSNYENPGYYGNQVRPPPPPYKQVEKQPDSGPNSAGASWEAQFTSVSSSRENYADVQNVEYNSNVEQQTSHESDDRLLSLEYDSLQESPVDSQYVGKSKNAENCAKSRLKKKALFKVEKGKADILLKCLQFVNTSTEITMSDNARRIVDTYMNEASNLHWKPILDRLQTEKEQKELLEKTRKTFKTGNQVTTNKMKRANFKHVK